jgi:hypothetical protein
LASEPDVLAKIEFVSGVLNIYKTISCGVDFGTEKSYLLTLQNFFLLCQLL